MTGAPLWVSRDADDGLAELYTRAVLEPDFDLDRVPGVIGSLRIEYVGEELSVSLDLDGVRGLRDALNRLLDDAAGPEAAPAQQQLQARVRRIADQLGEHTTDLAEVAVRAQDPWFAGRPKEVAEVVHRLAVQQQRVAASLGDLLSAIAGES